MRLNRIDEWKKQHATTPTIQFMYNGKQFERKQQVPF